MHLVLVKQSLATVHRLAPIGESQLLVMIVAKTQDIIVISLQILCHPAPR